MSKKNEVKKNTLDTRVRAIAESGKGKGMPNWFNLPQNKEKRMLHIDICKQLVKLSKDNDNFSISTLVYFAVGKNAHRLHVFLSGYTKIDEKKANKIFSWLKLVAKHYKNKKLFHNANVAHALCRFYDKYSTKTADFKAALEKCDPNEAISFKNAKMLVKALGIAKENDVEVAEAAVLEPSVVTA